MFSDMTDHAHGLPMQRCVPNAGSTMSQRFVNSGGAVPVWGPRRVDVTNGAASLSTNVCGGGA